MRLDHIPTHLYHQLDMAKTNAKTSSVKKSRKIMADKTIGTKTSAAKTAAAKVLNAKGPGHENKFKGVKLAFLDACGEDEIGRAHV